MNMRAYEKSQVSRRHDKYKRIQSIKRDLAKSVLLRIHEEIEIDPDVSSFRTPLLRQNDTALRLLRDYPETISNRITLGRCVMLQLDESVVPPELVVTLCDRPDESPETT